MHIDTIAILILVVYGSIHYVSLATLAMPIPAKVWAELSHADLYIHHEIELVHGYLIHSGAEMTTETIARNIEENLEVLEKIA